MSSYSFICKKRAPLKKPSQLDNFLAKGLKAADFGIHLLHELRIDLEIFAVRQSISQVAPESVISGSLHRILEAMRTAVNSRDYESFYDADYELHAFLVGLPGLPQLIDFWKIVWRDLREFHRTSINEYWPDLRVLYAEHEYLVETILSGDSASAEDGLRHHLSAVWFRMVEQSGNIYQNDDPLAKASAYLAFNYHREVQLKDVAQKVAFTSSGHLSKLFRQHYHCSFRNYLQQLRIHKASELLRDTRLSVSLIAKRVGYRDVSRFGQHFKRFHAKPPKEWRRQFNA